MLFHVFVMDRMNILRVIIGHRQKLMNNIVNNCIHFTLPKLDILPSLLSFQVVEFLPVFSFLGALIDVAGEEPINKYVGMVRFLLFFFLLVFFLTFLFLDIYVRNGWYFYMRQFFLEPRAMFT